jgi:hypothetical protein
MLLLGLALCSGLGMAGMMGSPGINHELCAECRDRPVYQNAKAGRFPSLQLDTLVPVSGMLTKNGFEQTSTEGLPEPDVDVQSLPADACQVVRVAAL